MNTIREALKIHKARLPHLKQILKLAKDELPELSTFENLMLPNFLFWYILFDRIAYYGSRVEVISFIAVRKNMIEMLITKPYHRRRGFGSELIHYAENKIRTRGHSMILMKVHVTALRYFEGKEYRLYSYLPMRKLFSNTIIKNGKNNNKVKQINLKGYINRGVVTRHEKRSVH